MISFVALCLCGLQLSIKVGFCFRVHQRVPDVWNIGVHGNADRIYLSCDMSCNVPSRSYSYQLDMRYNHSETVNNTVIIASVMWPLEGDITRSFLIKRAVGRNSALLYTLPSGVRCLTIGRTVYSR